MMSLFRSAILLLLLAACSTGGEQPTVSILPAAPNDVYPIHSCQHTRFDTDSEGCGNWQIYWDRVGRNDETRYWANCPWNPAAWACWKIDRKEWACPPPRGVP